METFAELFKKERLSSGKKFRDIKDYTGLSIGYLSDIENARRHPPEISLVEKIEEFFGITDKCLVKSAKKERANLSTGINYLIQAKPKLQELLLRADSLTENQFEDLLNRVRTLTEDTADEDRLFLNEENKNFYDWRLYKNQ